MILDDFRKALGQLGDPRFRRVLLLGLGLTIALLVALSIAAGWLVGWLVPDTLTLPWIGQVGFLDPLASGLSVVAVLGLSVFLMVPVASAFTGLFLEDVADAVEDRHYPQLPLATPPGFAESLRQSVNFLGLVLAVMVTNYLMKVAWEVLLTPVTPTLPPPTPNGVRSPTSFANSARSSAAGSASATRASLTISPTPSASIVPAAFWWRMSPPTGRPSRRA